MAQRLVAALILLTGLFCKAESADREAVRRAVKTHLSEVKTCYDDALKKDSHNKDSQLSGKIVLDFEVDNAGKVPSAKVNEKKSTLKSSDIEQCLIDKVKSWTFPPSPKGTIISVSYPFIFKSNK